MGPEEVRRRAALCGVKGKAVDDEGVAEEGSDDFAVGVQQACGFTKVRLSSAGACRTVRARRGPTINAAGRRNHRWIGIAAEKPTALISTTVATLSVTERTRCPRSLTLNPAKASAEAKTTVNIA